MHVNSVGMEWLVSGWSGNYITLGCVHPWGMYRLLQIGITALMVSVGGGHIEFAEALLQRGADVNLKDNVSSPKAVRCLFLMLVRDRGILEGWGLNKHTTKKCSLANTKRLFVLDSDRCVTLLTCAQRGVVPGDLTCARCLQCFLTHMATIGMRLAIITYYLDVRAHV